jgi:hypothetical protein
MKHSLKVLVFIIASLGIFQADAYCWSVVNQFGVTHVHCVAGPGPGVAQPGPGCWVNANGVEVCNQPAPTNCWINPNGVQVCGQPHCWINGNGVQVCN